MDSVTIRFFLFGIIVSIIIIDRFFVILNVGKKANRIQNEHFNMSEQTSQIYIYGNIKPNSALLRT